MDLVHNDVGDIIEVRLPLQSPEEDSSGAEHQPRFLAHFAFQADLVAYNITRLLNPLLQPRIKCDMFSSISL